MQNLTQQIKETMRDVMEDVLSSRIDKQFKQFIQETVDIRESLYVDYRDIMWFTAPDYDNPLTLVMSTILNEGLISTYIVDKTIEYIKSYLHLHPSQIRKELTKTGATHIIVIIPKLEYNAYHVDNAMRLCGYFRSRSTIKNIKDGNNRNTEWIIIQYEAEFQGNCCTDELRRNSPILIHLTPYYNINKIKHNGLVPRCNNTLFKYPERIYFLKGSTSQKEINMVGRVLCHTNGNAVRMGQHLPKDYELGDYAVIYIDLYKITNNIKFYPDPNMLNAVFTMENIPPSAIIKIEKRNFN